MYICLHVCLHIDWSPYGTFNGADAKVEVANVCAAMDTLIRSRWP